MQPSTPSVMTDNLLQHTSVAKVLSGNVSLGSGKEFDAFGIPGAFTQDNGNGIMLRWMFTTTTPEVLEHNLGRVPIGYIVTRKYKACDILDQGTNAGWTEHKIALMCTVVGAEVVIYVF